MEAVFPTFSETILFKNLQKNYLFSLLIYHQVPYVACFWMGCALAKDDILEKLRFELQKKKLLNTVVDIVVIFCLIVISNSITGVSMDLFSVPILVIFATDLVRRIKISKLIIKIGQKSTNMWLIHTFFCYYYYPVAQLIYKPQYAILIWLLLMVLTYIASVLVDILYVKAGYIIKKILPKNKI